MIEPLGFVGGKTVVHDYLREVGALFLKATAHQRTVCRAGGDLRVGSVGAVGVGASRSRAGASWMGGGAVSGVLACPRRALVFSKKKPDVPSGMNCCLGSLRALPELMVYDPGG